MSMAKNFSKRIQAKIAGGYSDNPEHIETNTSNEMKLKSFQLVKGKWRELCSFFRFYPDRFLDFIKDPSSHISLYFYQRIHLRVLLRYRRVFIAATRGTAKSYIVILAYILKCIFYPGIKLFICARGKEQAAKITQERLAEIFDH